MMGVKLNQKDRAGVRYLIFILSLLAIWILRYFRSDIQTVESGLLLSMFVIPSWLEYNKSNSNLLITLKTLIWLSASLLFNLHIQGTYLNLAFILYLAIIPVLSIKEFRKRRAQWF